MGKKVADLMSTGLRTVSSSTLVTEAAKVMKSEDVGSLPVVENDRIIGVITDRDLVVRALAEDKDPKDTSVGEIASRNPVTVTPEADLDEALQLMAQHQVRRLPVVENNRLVGVLAQADVALAGKDKETGALVEEVSRP